ncbi:ADP-ribosylation factor-like protein 2-binding protein isoform X1 [Mizuhopecten yessoensis]|uniref:ADP-ribosylation factor-like protein 2-binding protein isoform X1 n=1 Tax=Mizuhopecten yessoensis TaxID=6573 RepID=UPI000B45A42F|nr:ADP-ribosylation factor-like protein 2-binding protein isoform X1 [Mizuhopecten yessoensis]
MASNFDDDQADGIEPMDFSFHEDEDLAVSSSNAVDTKFDETIGHVEDIIMDDDFQRIQNEFLEKYYQEFDDTEENKFIYTDIHREYVQLIEKHLDDELTKRMPEFSMGEFTHQIMERKNELEGEIFEMLLTFSDFMAFKEMFLDFKADKEGLTVDLSAGIMVTSMQQGGGDDGADDCGDDGGISLDDCTFSLTGHSFGDGPEQK